MYFSAACMVSRSMKLSPTAAKNTISLSPECTHMVLTCPHIVTNADMLQLKNVVTLYLCQDTITKNVDMQINGNLLIFPYIAYSLVLHTRESQLHIQLHYKLQLRHALVEYFGLVQLSLSEPHMSV